MKQFHFSDLLTATTGRLVSSRHMEGVYEILNFLTGDDGLFTHQLPRAVRECEPWLRAQFPALMPDSPPMAALLQVLDAEIDARPENDTREARAILIAAWVERVRLISGMPEYVAVYEMGADMHTRIDPLEEAAAMVGDSKVLVIKAVKS